MTSSVSKYLTEIYVDDYLLQGYEEHWQLYAMSINKLPLLIIYVNILIYYFNVYEIWQQGTSEKIRSRPFV